MATGLASVTVDQTRFPGGDNRYQSPDYDSAANKVDIDIETGVGAVTVQERHRHRWEFNNEFRKMLGEAGLVFSGMSPDVRLV